MRAAIVLQIPPTLAAKAGEAGRQASWEVLPIRHHSAVRFLVLLTLAIAVLLGFLYFVWPTPYRHIDASPMPQRQHRLTREVQVFSGERWERK